MGYLSSGGCCTTINKEEQTMDTIYRLIEVYAGKLSNWAWDKRWKYRDQEKWLKGYREWKKRKCPHN
jgi:hypothetical protein